MPSVLIVCDIPDDEEENFWSHAERAMRRLGLTTSLACDGRDALVMGARESYDLVLVHPLLKTVTPKKMVAFFKARPVPPIVVLMVENGEPEVRQREAERLGAVGCAYYQQGVEGLAAQTARFLEPAEPR